ncbi:Glutamate racemase [Lactobacillus kullabergensis]|uniref:Glutamate racemase n=1 Tax=Lactobacillus kullabergensis TaxID=1218493 RepID=A0A0F4LIJ1_9LACO|nr:glutamate racemase [Lactobacillus kullabergensis]KJY58143.1 Glutamate racemase [Lactobacillus kullabergensis]
MDNRPIGLLDSGVGGLTVVKKIIGKMPHEATVFIGDNAHIPYGDKSKAEIIALTKQSVNFLLSKNVKLIIFACNTATAVAMKAIQKEIEPQIIGVIQSGAVAAANATKNKNVAVVATKMTVGLHAYQKEIQTRDPEITVSELATPQIVPLIEANAGHQAYMAALKKILLPINNLGVDTLVLGCTHYPIIRNEFAQCVKPAVQIIDPADQVAQYTYNIMKRDQMFTDSSAKGKHEYYTTGDVKMFDELGKIVLQDEKFSAQHL